MMAGVVRISVLLLPLYMGIPNAIGAVSVRDLGARGDGKSDDTKAFLAAVAQARASETHVAVPRGTYRVSRTVDLENVAIRGPEGAAWPADIGALPSIQPTHRDGPAFRLLAGGALRGLSIDYGWAEEPESGPAAVLISGIGVYISNLRIRYPWDGILTDGKSNVGRLNVENVFMVSPRNIGVRVTGTWDVPRLSNVEVWNAGPVKRGLEKGVGFHLGKNDLIRMTDCFAYAMQVGFLLEDVIEGCDIKGGTWGVMNGCATDYCGRSIVVDGAHTLSVSGGTFWTHQETLVVTGAGSRVRVSGSELKSNGAPCVVVQGGDHTVVSGCTLLRPMKQYRVPAVRLEAGSTVLSGNAITSLHDGIDIGAGTAAAVITGNLMSCAGRAIVSPEAKNESVLIEANVQRQTGGD